MGLLKTILFILLFYYAFKILSRFFAPILLKYFTKKAAERFGGFSTKQEPKHKEGDVIIDKMPNKKQSNKTTGEYVDFEEIE